MVVSTKSIGFKLNILISVSSVMFLLGLWDDILKIIKKNHHGLSESLRLLIEFLIGFAIGRLLSFSLDGKPNKQIIQGLLFEIVLGSANIICLVSSLA